MLGDDAFGNGLSSRDFRVEQDSRPAGSERGSYIQFEAAEGRVIHKGGIGFSQILAMVEGEGGEGSARGRYLLQSAQFSDGERFHVSGSKVRVKSRRSKVNDF
jgi:hypothetical protein